MRQIQWIKGGTGIGRSGAEGGEVLEGGGGGGGSEKDADGRD